MERRCVDPPGHRPLPRAILPYLWLGLLGAASAQVDPIHIPALARVDTPVHPAALSSENVTRAEEDPAGALLPRHDDVIPLGNCELLVRIEPQEHEAEVVELRLHLVDAHHTVATWAASPREGGQHRFLDLPPGIFHVEAWGYGDVAASATPWRCEGRGDRGALVLALPSFTVRLEGRLQGRKGHRPADAELLIEQPAGRRTGLRGPLHVPLDAEGRFHVALSPGLYTLLGLASLHAPRTTEVTLTDEGVRVSIALPYRPEVSGVVVDAAGHPVEGASVYTGPIYDPRVPAARVRTDATGRFTLPLSGDQAVTLAATAPAGFGTVSLPAGVEDAGPVVEVVLSLAPARQVRTIIEHVDGTPCSFCEVSFRLRSHGLGGSVYADERGRAILVGLPLDADVEVWPSQGATGAWAGRVATPRDSTVLLTYVPPSW